MAGSFRYLLGNSRGHSLWLTRGDTAVIGVWGQTSLASCPGSLLPKPCFWACWHQGREREALSSHLTYLSFLQMGTSPLHALLCFDKKDPFTSLFRLKEQISMPSPLLRRPEFSETKRSFHSLRVHFQYIEFLRLSGN